MARYPHTTRVFLPETIFLVADSDDEDSPLATTNVVESVVDVVVVISVSVSVSTSLFSFGCGDTPPSPLSEEEDDVVDLPYSVVLPRMELLEKALLLQILFLDAGVFGEINPSVGSIGKIRRRRKKKETKTKK